MGFAEVVRAGEGAQFPSAQDMREWAYAFLVERPFGTTITYEELTTVLTVSPSDNKRARDALLKAGRRLLREHNKQLVNVRTVGYRIIEPREHVGESRKQSTRARRRLRESLATVTHIALEHLTPAETAEALMEQARAAIQLGMCTRISRMKRLPARQEMRLPPASKLVDLMRRKQE